MQCLLPSSPRVHLLSQRHRQGQPRPNPSPRTAKGVDYITSPSNPFVKHCVRLRLSSSHRRSHRSLLLVGTTPIREVHDYRNSEEEGASAIDCLLVRDETQVPVELMRSAARVIRVSPSVMEKISGIETSESTEAVAVMRMPTTFLDLNDEECRLDCKGWFPLSSRILVLDAIQVTLFFLFFVGMVPMIEYAIYLDHTVNESFKADHTSQKFSEIFSNNDTQAFIPSSVINVRTLFRLFIERDTDYGFTLYRLNQISLSSFVQHLCLLILVYILQDPGNLGTLLRSAVAFNWDGVLLLPGCCDPFNDKAIRASRGAAFRLPVILGTWDHVEALVGEFRMKLLAGHPKRNGERQTVRVLCDRLISSLADVPICLVLGSEGRGLSEKSKTSCELVSISMSGKFESLNVSVAGGIFMFMLQPQNSNFSSSFSRPVCEGEISVEHR